jgi:hypothetical protein
MNQPTYTIEEALQNMLAAFDNPLTRLKMKDSWTDFHKEAVDSARNAINNGKPLYAPESNEILNENKSHAIFAKDVNEGEAVIFFDNDRKAILIPSDSRDPLEFIHIGYFNSDNQPHFYLQPNFFIKLPANQVVDRLIVQ